jgi:hypothetical protein
MMVDAKSIFSGASMRKVRGKTAKPGRLPNSQQSTSDLESGGRWKVEDLNESRDETDGIGSAEKQTMRQIHDEKRLI